MRRDGRARAGARAGPLALRHHQLLRSDTALRAPPAPRGSYDPAAIPALVRCLALLLSHGAHDGAGPTGYNAGDGASPSSPPPPRCATEALLVASLRQESSMALFEAEAARAGLQPADVSAELLGDAGGGDPDAAPQEAPPGAVRFCHLPPALLQRGRLRAHRLRPPQRAAT